MANNLGAPHDQPDSLGARLARLRAARNLTGRQLGVLVGMSQPKISRIENGAPAEAADVERIARALEAPDDLVVELVRMAELSHDRMTDWRPLGPTLADAQRSAAAFEADTQMLAVFQPSVIPGLIQSSDYARSVLTPFHELMFSAGEITSQRAVLQAVSARIQRQEILADPTRTFHFLMLENVLTDNVCAPEYMPAQLERLREVAKQDNVTVSVIPQGRRIIPPPMHGFELGDRSVAVDLLNTSLTSHGPADVAVYRQIFDGYAAQAVTDVDRILDHHLQRHLRALQTGRQHEPRANERRVE
ncbi:transcriptional regulator [Asanoa ishikariensis]|uniref:Transcriptional regulator, contains XRE-family HTH domain n=1 Tax=Asanoa ishikariensis TaxID=137265 RepID=A0A1H3UPG9_9ACTN|nr:helix-turn-helix transcriptional regulator [Asanoa ishikariensis]GIF69060.1 transcriptional regulator [Asanoa ishikariensis]SDZ63951.1 Transcriptional regulator, contains XRE-family HTH domain [Asanoa ishikariensis]